MFDALDLTATGSGYYRVWVDGVQISQHTTEREATERAVERKLAVPGAVVSYDHDYSVRVDTPNERRSGYERRQTDMQIGRPGSRVGQRRGFVRQYPATPTVGSVVVTSPAPPNLVPSDTFQMTVAIWSAVIPVEGTFPQSLLLTGRTVEWTSNDTNVVTVNSAGLVTYVGAGTATVTAKCQGVSASQGFTCTSPTAAVSSVTVAPTTFTVAPATTFQLAATVRDASGNVLAGRTVAWGSNNGAVATVGADSGNDNHTVIVTGVGTGTCTITATCETVPGTSACEVVSAAFDGLAELPRVEPNTAFSLPTGTVYSVTGSGLGSNLQTQLNAAATAGGNAIVVLEDNTEYVGTFTMNNAGGDWIYVMSRSAYENAAGIGAPPPSFPASGTRITTADLAKTARITINDGTNGTNFGPGMRITANGDHKIRFVGITFLGPKLTNGFSALRLGDSASSSTSPPSYFVVDRCLARRYEINDATSECKVGIEVNGDYVEIVDSYVYEIVSTGADNQAVLAIYGNGPLRIENCHLEAAGMNFMIGGASIGTTDMVYSDVTIRKCYLYKPTSWQNLYVQKNNFEIKYGRRILLEDTIIDGLWKASQAGTSFVLKTVNQGNGAMTWAATSDITVRYLIQRNSNNALSMAGNPENTTIAVPLTRVQFHDCLFYKLGTQADVAMWTNGRAGAISAMGSCSIKYCTFDSGTGSSFPRGWFLDTGSEGSVGPTTWQYNVWGGVTRNPGGGGSTPTVFEWATADGSACTDNLWYPTGSEVVSGTNVLPAGNTNVANAAAVLYTNYAGHDFSLQAGSAGYQAAPGGVDYGANMPSLLTKTAGCVSGAWS